MKRIGVYFPSGLGNAIQFLPFLINQINNGYEIYVYCKSKTSHDVFTKFSNVTHLFLLNGNKFSRLLALRKYKFDLFIFAQMYDRKFKFISYILRSREIYCYGLISYKFTYLTVLRVNLAENELYWPYRILEQKNVRITQGLKYPFIASKKTTMAPLQAKRKYLISIHLGCSAFYIHKRWNLSNFIKLVGNILSNFNAQILLIGSTDDIDISNQLKFKFVKDNVINTVPSFDIKKTLSLITRSHLFISGDSGLMHLAACTKTPQIAIFDNSTFFGKNIPVNKTKVLKIFGSIYKNIDEIKVEEVSKAVSHILKHNY